MEIEGVVRIRIVTDPGDRRRHPDHKLIVEFKSGRTVTLRPTFEHVTELVRASVEGVS